jgi:hypothetical protein
MMHWIISIAAVVLGNYPYGCNVKEYTIWKSVYNNATPFNLTSCQTFTENQIRVNSHNSNPKSTWQATINHPFADGEIKPQKSRPAKILQRPNQSWIDVTLPEMIPVDINHWSDNGVTDTKDQGQYGNCWAEAASGVLEWLYAKQSKGTQLIKYSAQQLSDCSGDGDGCNGGFSYDALVYAQHNQGISTTKDYPYTGCQSCNQKLENATRQPLNITGVYKTKSGDELELLKVLIDNVVAVAIDASGDGFMNYGSGVYNGIYNGNPDCCADYSCLDHEVLAVGYKLSFANDLLNYSFYIVKNSWSVNWGNLNGYIFMEYGNNVCGIADDTAYAQID